MKTGQLKSDVNLKQKTGHHLVGTKNMNYLSEDTLNNGTNSTRINVKEATKSSVRRKQQRSRIVQNRESSNENEFRLATGTALNSSTSKDGTLIAKNHKMITDEENFYNSDMQASYLKICRSTTCMPMTGVVGEENYGQHQYDDINDGNLGDDDDEDFDKEFENIVNRETSDENYSDVDEKKLKSFRKVINLVCI